MSRTDSINYDHARNLHTQAGPSVALPLLLDEPRPSSILDVGCGRGTWLLAALECGVSEVVGVDGVNIPKQDLLFPPSNFHQHDLRQRFDLRRRFGCLLCLEVAEHLEEFYAGALIESLTIHSDAILFSAACPGQPGQYHVNCKWPDYWQQIFNQHGFACTDSVRWRIWDDSRIEPWYRQNIFFARKDDSAGKEKRILAVIHPEMVKHISSQMRQDTVRNTREKIQEGRMPSAWYFKTVARALTQKLRRRMRSGNP